MRLAGYNSSDYHVCIGLSGVPATRMANSRLRNQRQTRQPNQRSPGCTGLSGVSVVCLANDRPRQSNQRSPGCIGLSGVPSDQRSTRLNKEGDRLMSSVRCTPVNPVHPRTEGNHGLPK
jgi:hypothetical protein